MCRHAMTSWRPACGEASTSKPCTSMCAPSSISSAPPRASRQGREATTQTIQIPISESLTDAQMDRVASVVRDAVVSLGDEAPVAVHQS